MNEVHRLEDQEAEPAVTPETSAPPTAAPEATDHQIMNEKPSSPTVEQSGPPSKEQMDKYLASLDPATAAAVRSRMEKMSTAGTAAEAGRQDETLHAGNTLESLKQARDGQPSAEAPSKEDKDIEDEVAKEAAATAAAAEHRSTTGPQAIELNPVPLRPGLIRRLEQQGVQLDFTKASGGIGHRFKEGLKAFFRGRKADRLWLTPAPGSSYVTQDQMDKLMSVLPSGYIKLPEEAVYGPAEDTPEVSEPAEPEARQ